MNDKIIDKLIEEAKDIASKNFCCDHSGFTVGAALLTKDGKVYKGFNIENDGIQSICAERVAFCKALSEESSEFDCIVVVGKPQDAPKYIKTLPCGYCRQFMSEYVKEDFMIYTYDDKEQKLYTYNITEIFPESFSL
jgi:cytidine deaminase